MQESFICLLLLNHMMDSVQVTNVNMHAHDFTFCFIFPYRSMVSDAMIMGAYMAS